MKNPLNKLAQKIGSTAGRVAGVLTARHKNLPQTDPNESNAQPASHDGHDKSFTAPISQPFIETPNPERQRDRTTDDQHDPGEESFRQTQLRHSRIMVICTFFIALATVAYMFFAYLQWREIHTQVDLIRESSNDTRQMIATTQNTANAMRDVAVESGKTANAATNQAIAAGEQVGISQRQANTSAAQAESMKQLAGASEKQAQSSQVTAGAAETSAKTAERNAQIALVGLLPKINATLEVVTFEPSKPMRAIVSIENEGTTTAVKCISEAHLIRFELPFLKSWNIWKTEASEPGSVNNLAPQKPLSLLITTPDVISPVEFQRIYDGRRELQVWAWGHYGDEFAGLNHSFLFCWSYDHTLHRMTGCTQEQYAEY